MNVFGWRVPRRIVSIGGVFLGLIIVIGLMPVLLIAAVVADAILDWRRHRFARILGGLTAYLLNEAAGVLALFGMWVLTGFGAAMHTERSYRMHGRLHGWWTNNLLEVFRFFFGARYDVKNLDAVQPSPVIILARHISLLDAVVPSVLLTRHEWNAPRHVLMRGLRWAPCIDILGHRTPNYFVDRQSRKRDDETAPIRKVGASVEPHGSGVIFPEGGFRTPARFARAIERLQESNPTFAERAMHLRHVMPPRPAGSAALLDGAPGVDAVIVTHIGFEGFGSVGEILANTPFRRTVEIDLRRIPREEIPEPGSDEFTDWLMVQYEWIDDWVDQRM